MVDGRSQALSPTSLLAAPPSTFWWLALSGLFLATLGYLLQRFSRLFYLYEFDHAHND